MTANGWPLDGRRILLVEDNYGIAKTLAMLFQRYGAIILGPAGTLESAMALVEAEAPIDGAVLDVNVRDKLIYPVARILRRRGVRMVFVTGYDRAFIDPEFADIPCVLKPWNAEQLMKMLGDGTGTGAHPAA